MEVRFQDFLAWDQEEGEGRDPPWWETMGDKRETMPEESPGLRDIATT